MRRSTIRGSLSQKRAPLMGAAKNKMAAGKRKRAPSPQTPPAAAAEDVNVMDPSLFPTPLEPAATDDDAGNFMESCLHVHQTGGAVMMMSGGGGSGGSLPEQSQWTATVPLRWSSAEAFPLEADGPYEEGAPVGTPLISGFTVVRRNRGEEVGRSKKDDHSPKMDVMNDDFAAFMDEEGHEEEFLDDEEDGVQQAENGGGGDSNQRSANAATTASQSRCGAFTQDGQPEVSSVPTELLEQEAFNYTYRVVLWVETSAEDDGGNAIDLVSPTPAKSSVSGGHPYYTKLGDDAALLSSSGAKAMGTIDRASRPFSFPLGHFEYDAEESCLVESSVGDTVGAFEILKTVKLQNGAFQVPGYRMKFSFVASCQRKDQQQQSWAPIPKALGNYVNENIFRGLEVDVSGTHSRIAKNKRISNPHMLPPEEFHYLEFVPPPLQQRGDSYLRIRNCYDPDLEWDPEICVQYKVYIALSEPPSVLEDEGDEHGGRRRHRHHMLMHADNEDNVVDKTDRKNYLRSGTRWFRLATPSEIAERLSSLHTRWCQRLQFLMGNIEPGQTDEMQIAELPPNTSALHGQKNGEDEGVTSSPKGGKKSKRNAKKKKRFESTRIRLPDGDYAFSLMISACAPGLPEDREDGHDDDDEHHGGGHHDDDRPNPQRKHVLMKLADMPSLWIESSNPNLIFCDPHVSPNVGVSRRADEWNQVFGRERGSELMIVEPALYFPSQHAIFNPDVSQPFRIASTSLYSGGRMELRIRRFPNRHADILRIAKPHEPLVGVGLIVDPIHNDEYLVLQGNQGFVRTRGKVPVIKLVAAKKDGLPVEEQSTMEIPFLRRCGGEGDLEDLSAGPTPFGAVQDSVGFVFNQQQLIGQKRGGVADDAGEDGDAELKKAEEEDAAKNANKIRRAPGHEVARRNAIKLREQREKSLLYVMTKEHRQSETSWNPPRQYPPTTALPVDMNTGRTLAITKGEVLDRNFAWEVRGSNMVSCLENGRGGGVPKFTSQHLESECTDPKAQKQMEKERRRKEKRQAVTLLRKSLSEGVNRDVGEEGDDDQLVGLGHATVHLAGGAWARTDNAELITLKNTSATTANERSPTSTEAPRSNTEDPLATRLLDEECIPQDPLLRQLVCKSSMMPRDDAATGARGNRGGGGGRPAAGDTGTLQDHLEGSDVDDDFQLPDVSQDGSYTSA